MVITDANLTKLILDWCNKGRGMYCLVCGIVHIKDPLLLIGNSNPCSGGSDFPHDIIIIVNKIC